MAHRVGDILIALEDSGFTVTHDVERHPARLSVEAEVAWIDGKDLWVRLPETRVVLAGQALRLPATKIKLPRMTESFSWRSQSFEPAVAARWDGAPFYRPVMGRRATAAHASYFTRAAWIEHERSLGDLPPDRPLQGLAGHAACLGVALDASRDQVLEAFRQKAKAAHPDAGGDPELFRRLMEARTALLLKK